MRMARVLLGVGMVSSFQTVNYPRFLLPAFPYIRPAKYRSDLQQIEAAATDWIRTELRGMFSSSAAMEFFIEQRTSLWSILCYPNATADRLLAICNAMNFFFASDAASTKIGPDASVDELFERGYAAMTDHRMKTSSPWVRPLQAISGRFRADMSTGLYRRYVDATKAFLDGIVAERRLRAGGKLAELDEYDRIRKRTIGGFSAPLAEYGAEVDLTKEFEICPELAEIGDTALRNWIAINDIFSYRKELYAGDKMNKIAVLMEAQSLSLQEAIDRVAEAARREERRFHGKREIILAGSLGGSPAVQRYMEAIWFMMAGNLEWSYLTPRYHGRAHVWNRSPCGAVTLTPSRTMFEAAS